MKYITDFNYDLTSKLAKTPFYLKLTDGNIGEYDYANYLHQLMLYTPLIELGIFSQNMFLKVLESERSPFIFQDFLELAQGQHFSWLPETQEYANYLMSLLNDPENKWKISVHFYHRFMDDIDNNATWGRTVPGSRTMYNFYNLAESKAEVYDELRHEELFDESRIAIQFRLKIFTALGNRPIT